MDLLHEMILNGELLPGERINEVALCSRFGVSRTPLREALKILASSGVVILSPNRGATIAQISPQEVDQLFPILGALEALAGELACLRITDAQITRIRKLHEQMVRYYEKKEAAPYLKINRQIHEAIFDAAGNPELTQLYHNVMVRTNAVRFTTKKSPARWDEAVADHERIMAALEKRDGPGLGKILAEHLAHKAATVHEALLGRDAAE